MLPQSVASLIVVASALVSSESLRLCCSLADLSRGTKFLLFSRGVPSNNFSAGAHGDELNGCAPSIGVDGNWIGLDGDSTMGSWKRGVLDQRSWCNHSVRVSA